MDFDALTQQLKTKNLHKVDSRTWSSSWGDRWVAFADLIGFKYRCEHNPKTVVVNMIFGFHRALQSSVANLEGVRLHQFADAAFAISDSCESIVKFVTQLQHQCLAHNAVRIEEKQLDFRYMMLPRITIARGSVFQLPDRPFPDRDLAGILTSHVLAGKGIVNAYKLETSSAGTLVSASQRDAKELREIPLKSTRGTQKNKHTIDTFRRWQDNPEALSHDGAVDLPWLLLRPLQASKNGLVIDNINSLQTKLRALICIWELGFKEYVQQRTFIGSIKHYGAVQRHLTELVQLHKKRRSPTKGSLADLNALVDQLI